MTDREWRLRERIDVLNDRIDQLERTSERLRRLLACKRSSLSKMRESRDLWKRKAVERGEPMRIRIRDLERSRDHWKGETRRLRLLLGAIEGQAELAAREASGDWPAELTLEDLAAAFKRMQRRRLSVVK